MDEVESHLRIANFFRMMQDLPFSLTRGWGWDALATSSPCHLTCLFRRLFAKMMPAWLTIRCASNLARAGTRVMLSIDANRSSRCTCEHLNTLRGPGRITRLQRSFKSSLNASVKLSNTSDDRPANGLANGLVNVDIVVFLLFMYLMTFMYNTNFYKTLICYSRVDGRRSLHVRSVVASTAHTRLLTHPVHP